MLIFPGLPTFLIPSALGLMHKFSNIPIGGIHSVHLLVSNLWIPRPLEVIAPFFDPFTLANMKLYRTALRGLPLGSSMRHIARPLRSTVHLLFLHPLFPVWRMNNVSSDSLPPRVWLGFRDWKRLPALTYDSGHLLPRLAVCVWATLTAPITGSLSTRRNGEWSGWGLLSRLQNSIDFAL